MLSLRERLRAGFVRSVESLVGCIEAAGELETAVECCEKALEVDDLAEEFYQHLITCHLRLGRPAKALSVYNRCRSALEAGLGIEPSAGTRSLLGDFRSKR
jgi:pentatricopeptide repeat protein